MSIGVLGPVVITDRAGHHVPIPGRKARALLALLAIRVNRVVPVEQLEDELWCGTPPTGARTTLHAHISRLRGALRDAGASAELLTTGCGYQLTISPDELDSARFELLARAGAHTASPPTETVSRLARSLEEWRGAAFQDLHDYEPLFLEAQRLEELRLVAIEERWTAELELGGHLLAVGQLQRLVVDYPFRERLQGLFLLALHRSGRQTEALRAYQVAVNALAEIGLTPGPDLRSLEQRIAAQDPALDLEASTAPAATLEEATVARAWNDALGATPMVLVVDHGTRATTLDLLSRCARAAGAAVLHGELPQISARPFAVVADALRLILTSEHDRYCDLAGPLAPIVDEDPPSATTIGLDGAERRVRAFDAVTAVLARVGDGRPVLLILEQIDLAGDSTLDLVEHLVHADTAQPLVVVLTVASGESNRSGVTGRLARAEREGSLRRLTVTVPRGGPETPPRVAVDGGDHATKALVALNTAVEHSARAGDEALARLGYAEAMAHYRLALSTLDLCGSSQPRRRTELLLAHGRACHVAYELTDALTMFRLAARSAASIGDIALLNEAACGLAFATEFAMADSETVELLAHALRGVPADSPRRVELLAGLARTMPQDDRRSRSHAATAVALARRLGDPRALALALATWILVTWGPDDAASRLGFIDETIAVGDELAWVDLVVEARNWRAATLIQLGREVEAATDTARLDEWARQSGRPFFVALAAMRHIGRLLEEGRLDEAECALSNPPVGAHSSPNFSEAAAAQLFLLRVAQGRAAELLALIESFLEGGQAPFAWRAAHVLTLAQSGDRRAADALHAQVVALRRAPRNWLWLSGVTLLADACVALGDRRCAPVLESALRGHRGETVVVAHGIASLGPVSPRLDALQSLLTLEFSDHKELASAS